MPAAVPPIADHKPAIGSARRACGNETVIEHVIRDTAAPVTIREHAYAPPGPDRLRPSIGEGRNAFTETTS